MRLPFIDKLKALAMMLVVWGHTMYFCMYHEENASDPVLNIICTFHVPLFFFLSGFVISEAPDIHKFLRKARKFLVPMLVVGFINALLFDGVRDFFLNDGHFGYWYLLMLTVFYLLLVPFRYASSFPFTLALSTAFWLVMYLCIDSSNVVISALNPGGAFAYWPFFIIGYICRKYFLIGGLARRFAPAFIVGKPWFAALLVVVYLTLLVLSFRRIDNLPLAFDFTIALVAIAALMTLFFHFGDSRTFIDRQFLLIGNSTLDIYIYHYFFIRIINLDFLKAQSLPVEIAVTITLTIAIVYCSIAIGRLVAHLSPSSSS
ncbi:MAG: acyltransferase [Prevotella sp.]|nr:acyltransferase [Prevotella sp.]